METAPLTFRTATSADVSALVTLIDSAYRGEASRVGWTTEADLLDGQRTDAEAVADAATHPDGWLLVAERDGELLACCQLERQSDGADGYVAYFGMFAVRPGLQGTGLGRAVLAQAERTAVERWSVREMRMQVLNVREELIAWYQRRGYSRTGRLVPFPYGDQRFGLPRRGDLVFEVLVKALG